MTTEQQAERLRLIKKIQPLCPQDWQVGDRGIDKHGIEWVLPLIDDGQDYKEMLHIPDVVSRDPDRPERGLWGILRSITDYEIEYQDLTKDEYSEDCPTKGINLWSTGRNVIVKSFPGTIELALLRALEWQMDNNHD